MPPAWQSLGLDRTFSVRLGSLETNDCCSPGVFLEAGIHSPGQGPAPARSVQVQAGRPERVGDESLENPDCVCAAKKFWCADQWDNPAALILLW